MSAQDFDASDYERPRRCGVRGVIEAAGAVVHLCLWPHRGAWRAEAILELENAAGSLQVPLAFEAPTARDAWAALNAELTSRVGRFFA